MKKVGMGVALITLAGCGEVPQGTYDDALRKYSTYSNVRAVERGYVMYEIEGGTVTCREHTHRSELTCWKK